MVAAHNLALRRWLADGGRPEDAESCREQFRRVAPMLPLGGGEGGENGLEDVTRRLERAARTLERGARG